MSTDLVVVLPGIMGSTLRRDGHLVWAPSGGAALRAIRTFGASITDLRLPEGIGDDYPDDHPGDGVEPDQLMPDRHILPGLWTPLKGYDRILGRLRRLGFRDVSRDPQAPPGNLLPVAYDWRLSNRYNAQRLSTIVEPALARWRAKGGRYATARLVFVCHSMGGLVARWYVHHCGGAELTRKIIMLGTPQRGALKALDQLVNGVDPRIGPLARHLTDFARSLPSLHQLLPEYACLRHGRDLLTLDETTVPELKSTMVADAMAFHRALRQADADHPATAEMSHLIVGFRQATATTASVQDGRLVAATTYQGSDLGGDATVPLVGATPAGVPLDTNTIRRIADKHGNLQYNRAALDEVEATITAQPIIPRDTPPVEPRVEVPELVLPGTAIQVRITLPEQRRHGLTATLTDEHGAVVEVQAPGSARVARPRCSPTSRRAPTPSTSRVAVPDRQSPRSAVTCWSGIPATLRSPPPTRPPEETSVRTRRGTRR